MVIGLTGGIGSGKTTVAKMFANYHNIAVYNADIEAKKLMNSSIKLKTALIKAFGSDAYKNNTLNKPYLSDIVFKNKEKLAILNSIVHPAVYEHLKNFIKKNKNKPYIIYENAILFENNSNKFCDKIITVTAPLETRIKRVVERDCTTEDAVRYRIQNQWNDAIKVLQSNYVVNNKKLKDTEKAILKIHNILTNILY